VAIVYQATNLINGKRYIGVTAVGLESRRRRHVRDAKNCRGKRPFYAAIAKYGDAMFRFAVLKVCALRHEAFAEERRLIQVLRPEYNASAGGEGNCGYTHSAEAKAKLSRAGKGRTPWNKGIPASPDAITKRLASYVSNGTHGGRAAGWHHTPESIAKMRAAHLANPTRAWLGKKLLPHMVQALHRGRQKMVSP
jgi:group I intron endonuclease